ncbi:hypothetical protein Bca52824_029333 [Brassica carinata]|uniref:Sas10 C-terminal domain-containing protein n=1 Tax=Brassica carinata TaxID=52824 RepID=A0A8X7VEL6_BRACI|nr:hypothetical protein Bca52824_029333 [Brassica carinata]
MRRKLGSEKRGSVSTKTRREIDEDKHDDEIDALIRQSKHLKANFSAVDDDEYLKAEEEEVLRLRAEQIGSITAADAGLEDGSEEEEERDRELTMEPVKINKSRADARKKGEKRKHQQIDQVDVQSEEMLKLRAALQGKLRSNEVTVSKTDKAQKRQKLAKRRKFELKVLAGAGVKSDEDGRNESEVVASEGSEDEFYKQVKQKKDAKRAAKAEFYSREPSSNLLLIPESVDGKRLISNEDKYTDKVKRRGGQVREIRKPSGPYGGEVSGINTNISHSIRIKN